MKISLVTAVKDEAATLEQLIEGVASQTRQADEWIVVDGGSRDRSAELLDRAGCCTVLSAAGNIARGRNAGLAAASGEIVATIDAGCRPRRDWLERLVTPLEEGRARVTAGSTEPRIDRPFDAAQAALLDQFSLPIPGGRLPALSARCLAFRREVWQRDPFPEWLDHGEDAWLLRQWARSGNPPLRVPEAIVEWRLRPSVGSFVRQHFRYMRGDGRAAMNSPRHLLRWSFYALVLTAALLAAREPLLGWVAAATWLGYAALTALRLATLPGHVRAALRLRAIPLLLALLPLMDGAKMVGYLIGRLDRLGGNGPR